MTQRLFQVSAAAATLVAASLLLAGTAAAGQCPKDKQGVDVTPPSTAAAKGVTDNVIGAIDVAKEPAAIEGRGTTRSR